MVKGHRIEKKVEVKTFLDLIGQYTEGNVEATQHTFFRLIEEQRKVFKLETIKNILFKDVHKIILASPA